jgi:hypothetical protein
VLFFGFSTIIFSWFGVPSGSLRFRFTLQRFINLSTVDSFVKGLGKRIFKKTSRLDLAVVLGNND